MRVLCAILLGGLALVGAAEARLGQSLEEIRERHGQLEERDDRQYPSDLVVYEPRTLLEGFDVITYAFFKKDRLKKCIRVTYLKYYETRTEVDKTLSDGEVLIDKNFPDPLRRPRKISGMGTNAENAFSPNASYRVMYGVEGNLDKESAMISVGRVEGISSEKWAFNIMCQSRELGDFIRGKIIRKLTEERSR